MDPGKAVQGAENEACVALKLAGSPISWSKPFPSLDLLSIKIQAGPGDLWGLCSESLNKFPSSVVQETGENQKAR